MAYAFGESYVKLPPITGESTVEIDSENSKRISSGIGRDNHGLVRLPPIVRFDSPRSVPSTAQVFPSTPGENKTEMSTKGANLKISQKMNVLQRDSSKQLRKHTAEKCEDEEKLMSSVTVKETSEIETNVLDSIDWSYHDEKAGLLKSKERSRELQGDYEVLASSKDSLTSRRGSASVIKDSVKLSRSRRLAKSSPELCYRKINLKYRAGGNFNEDNVTSLPNDLSCESGSHRSQARLSIHDIDGSVLSHWQSTSKLNEKMAKRKKRVRRQTDGKSSYQPLSTPNSPVCSESANNERKENGRRSLNDITEAVKQFVDRRRPSISLSKKQNLVGEIVKLKIEGKSCPQAEMSGGRTPTLSNDASDRLQPPQNNEKRPSLYDLRQILGLLQEDDFKHQSSSTSSPSEGYNNAQNGRNSKSRNASVYDLREFLKLTVANETAVSEKEIKKSSGNKTGEIKTQGVTSSSVLLSPKQERGRHLDEARKGSVYDLKEFLSLGNAVDSNSASASENSSRPTSPQLFFSPRSSKKLLCVTQPTAEERRSSTYDLMEFLSLPQSGGISRPHSGQSDSFSQGDNTKFNNREFKVSETDRDGREARSLSVYDLAEYLAMTSGVPPLVRVISPGEDQTENNPIKGNTYKRKSVYDLQEMLNVMQQEHEAKRESTYNLPEILAYLHRETNTKDQEDKTAIQSENFRDDKTESFLGTSPPSPSISSGYSSDSRSSAVSHTESNLKGVEVNHSQSSRQMSVYDLREFLSQYASQNISSSHKLPPEFRRKFSNISQSGISIHVTDEWNRSLDLETDDVFLPVPRAEAARSPEKPKRSSVYDLREFLDLLNADDSPLRRRLSSVSSASSKSRESDLESFQPGQNTPDANSPSLGFGGANENPASSRPGLSPRQDSEGNVSLYDLGEFLSILNTDDSPLRRRLSSASDSAARDDSRNQADDSEKSPLYSLGEILSVLNDFEPKKVNENAAEEHNLGAEDEISITVPLLPQTNEKTNSQASAPRKRLLTSEKSLTSVRETSE